MYDIVAVFVSPEHIREATFVTNFVSAIIIGPFLAFAITPDAGIRCKLALLRFFQRIALVLFSIALMYNCTFIIMTGQSPSGPALLINLFIFLTTVISAVRHYLAPGVSQAGNWAWWNRRQERLKRYGVAPR